MLAVTTPGNVTDGLRSMLLNLKPKDIRCTQVSRSNPVFGLMIEIGFAKGSFALASLVDGTTSLYFSEGGVIIGGGQRDHVRSATGSLLAEAQVLYQAATRTVTFQKPEMGQVIFHFMTLDGVYSYATRKHNLNTGMDRLSNLYSAARDVIIELSKIKDIRYATYHKPVTAPSTAPHCCKPLFLPS